MFKGYAKYLLLLLVVYAPQLSADHMDRPYDFSQLENDGLKCGPPLANTLKCYDPNKNTNVTFELSPLPNGLHRIRATEVVDLNNGTVCDFKIEGIKSRCHLANGTICETAFDDTNSCNGGTGNQDNHQQTQAIQNRSQAQLNADFSQCQYEAQQYYPNPQPVYGSVCGPEKRSAVVVNAMNNGLYVPPSGCPQSVFDRGNTGSYEVQDQYGRTRLKGQYEEQVRTYSSLPSHEMRQLNMVQRQSQDAYYLREQHKANCMSAKGWQIQ
jgi:hypothetical protein